MIRLACFLVLLGASIAGAWAASVELRGSQFLGFSQFTNLVVSPGAQPGESVLTSPEIRAGLLWNELVASWNAEMPDRTWLKVEVRALYPRRTTKYYTLGLYSGNPARHPRQSVPHQKDADGDVATDTLLLKAPCERLQLRLTLGGESGERSRLKFVGLSLIDSKASPEPLPPNRAAWGRTIPVPERSQMVYSNGAALCSPTTVSMLLSHWSERLKRTELDCDVPVVAEGVNDPAWPGTGNWPFNTAYAGSFPGLRAYVARLTDLAEVEDWIALGYPVALSVDLIRLLGRTGAPSGHLVACVGFTENGDPILNDPGTRLHVRKVVPRKQLIEAWTHSHKTVYFIYPEDAPLPADRFCHWDSPAPGPLSSAPAAGGR